MPAAFGPPVFLCPEFPGHRLSRVKVPGRGFRVSARAGVNAEKNGADMDPPRWRKVFVRFYWFQSVALTPFGVQYLPSSALFL